MWEPRSYEWFIQSICIFIYTLNDLLCLQKIPKEVANEALEIKIVVAKKYHTAEVQYLLLPCYHGNQK